MATARSPDLATMIRFAGLLRCMWGFSEIGRRLARGTRPKDPRYARWIDMYADPGFAELARWCRNLLDRLAEGAPASVLERLETIFVESSRHEWRAWQQEQWPL